MRPAPSLTTRLRSLPSEPVLVAAGLAALAVLAYGSYVLHGGFYSDDWQLQATTTYHPRTFSGPIDPSLAAYRPVLALLLPGVHLLLGVHPHAYLALAALLTTLTAGTLVLVLRRAGVSRPTAVAAGALALLFPWAAATRLWPTGAINHVAVILVLLGFLAGLEALDRPGREGLLRRGAAVVLPVLGVLTYEAVAIPALAAIVVYAHRAGWRRALRLWRWQALAIVAALGWNLAHTSRTPLTRQHTIHHAYTIADQALRLLGFALEPFGSPPRVAVLAAGLALCLGGAWLSRRRPAGDPAARAMREGLALVVAGLVVVGAGYVLYVPAGLRYEPLDPGLGGRIQLIAPFGYALAVAGIAAVAGGVVATAAPRRLVAVVGALAAGALVVALGAGYGARLGGFEHDWEQASARQARVLALIRRARPRLRPGAVVYLTGEPLDVNGAPIFSRPWDLNGAIKITLAESNVGGLPLGPGRELSCGSSGPGFDVATATAPPRHASYATAMLLDARTGRMTPIDSVATCRADNARIAARRQVTDQRASRAAAGL